MMPLTSPTPTNSGTITVNATRSSSYAFAIGILADGDVSGSITNSSDITVEATSTSNQATAIGIRVDDSTTGMVTNSGTITLDVSGSDAVEAFGIDLLDGLFGQATNSGTIDIDFESFDDGATLTGIYVGGDVAPGGSLVNSGSIEIDGSANDYVTALGIYISSDVDGTLTNSGTIDMDLTARRDAAEATGIHIGGNVSGSGSMVNSGTIEIELLASSDAAVVNGILAESDIEGTLENSGTIDVSATGASSFFGLANSPEGSAPSAPQAMFYQSGEVASAFGIDVDRVEGALTNSGDITVSAEGLSGMIGTPIPFQRAGSAPLSMGLCCSSSSTVVAAGIEAGDVIEATLSNSGSIDVSANFNGGSNATALGMVTNDLIGGTVSNSGDITVVAGTEDTEALGTASAFALGIEVDDFSGAPLVGTRNQLIPTITTGTVENTGTITVSAFGAFEAGAIGIEADEMEGSLTNSGDITVSSALTGTGLLPLINNAPRQTIGFTGAGSLGGVGLGIGEIDGDVTNSGTITVNVEGDHSSGILGAAGIGSFSMGSGSTLENSGVIQVTADAPNFGGFNFLLNEGPEAMGPSIGVGTIGSTPNAVAGILISGEISAGATLTHSGTIDVSTTAEGGFPVICGNCITQQQNGYLGPNTLLTVGIGALSFNGVMNVTGDILVDGPAFTNLVLAGAEPQSNLFAGPSFGGTYGIYLPSGTGTLNITTEATINAPILVNEHDVNLDAVGGSQVYFFQDLDSGAGVFEATVSDGRSAWFVEDEGGNFPIYATVDGGEVSGGFTGQELADLGRVFDGIDAIFNPPGFNRAKRAAHEDDGFSTFVLGDAVHRSYDADGSRPEVRTNVGALLVGTTTELSTGTKLAFSMGILSASADDGVTDVDTDAVVFGANVGFSSGPWTLSAGLGLGLASNNSARRITGSTDANGDFDSRFISASLAASRDMTLGGLDVKAFGRLRHTHQNADGYTETGSTSNATVGERSTSVTELRLGAELERMVSTNTTVRAGLAGLHRAVSGDDVVDISLFGSTQTLATGADDFTGAEVTLGFEHDMGGGAVFDFEAVQNFGSGQTDLSLSAGVKINF